MSRKDNASEMAKLVGRYKESGQSKKAFSASHGLSEGKLHYWIGKLSKTDKVSSLTNKSTFVPIEISPSLSGVPGQAILIRLKNGVEIEIPV